MNKECCLTGKERNQRIRWFGQLARKNKNNIGKIVFERNPENRRGRGRLMLRWKDNVVKAYRKYYMEEVVRIYIESVWEIRDATKSFPLWHNPWVYKGYQ